MIWKWKRDRLEAEDALRQSTAQLESIHEQQSEVTQLVTTLRAHAHANHFIERLNMHVTRGHQ